ncbi:GSCFA domain-containing protein [Chryseolinea sp. T2]|uniref:GSCFA domain-containing protein n=1 Tax=Chryseolinea sp. T2 TaxID=3129255 RepID=UPI00307889E1
MHDFRTVLKPVGGSLRMAISDRIFTIGSCFSDAIGHRLATYKLTTYPNPTGISYNPYSIHRLLDFATNSRIPSKNGYTSGEVVFHYDFHSSLCAISKNDLDNTLQSLVTKCAAALKDSTWLIITYGTAWIYKRKDSGDVVANCHKQPSDWFDKQLLTVEDVGESFDQLHRRLKGTNPGLNIILTISPVRHVKDTLEGNSVSKSILRVACENISRSYSNVFYFPAYEIMMDDLRDYRFYKSDMIHPNDVAEEYIWEKFTAAWFDNDLLAFIKSWKGIIQAMEHRPFHPGTDAHQSFLKATLQRIDAWTGYADVEKERQLIRGQLIDS